MPSVQHSAELIRILGIPRREWSPEQGEELATVFTEALKMPGGTMRLMPHQAIALAEIAQLGGVFLPLPVGAGKTLISLLAPVVLATARRTPIYRPLLVVPASLLEKTERDEAELRKHWKLPPYIAKISYERLSRASSAAFLITSKPDMIIIDEGHKWKNVKASSSRKGLRYLHDHPEVPFVVLTGSPIGTSIKDTAHLMSRALGHLSPLPRTYLDIEEWASAIDIEARNPFDEGALRALALPDEEIRSALQRRIVQTPGIVTMRGVTIDTPIKIRSHVRDLDDDQIEALTNLRKLGQTPDGELAEDSLAIARHASELALGFYSVWDPRPPSEWLARRRAWHSICRDVLDSNRREIDSAEQLTLHMSQHPDHYLEAFRAWRDWKEIEPEYTKKPVPKWFSNQAIEHTERWIRAREREQGGSIVWVGRPAFGLRLAAFAGIPYFGEMGLDARGNSIEAATGHVIASSDACGTGLNLQHAFSKNLWIHIPRSPQKAEQRIGRTHRLGQKAKQVEIDLSFGIIEDAIRFEASCMHAANAQAVMGQAQKLCLADCTEVDVSESLSILPGPQWRRSAKKV